MNDNMAIDTHKTLIGEDHSESSDEKSDPEEKLPISMSETVNSDYSQLKNRKDVVFKTLLRAIRRFFSLKYRDIYPRKRYRLAESKARYFNQCIKSFVQQIIEQSENSTIGSDQGVIEATTLSYLMGEFINPSLNKSMMSIYNIEVDPSIKKFSRTFASCCKSYSHNLFDEVIHTKTFRMLFRVFIANFKGECRQKISGVVNNEDTYQRVIDEISMKLFHSNRHD